jgi:3-dehydroquinate synthase
LEKIIINTGDSLSAILIGARWEAVIKLLPERRVMIVTDQNVFDLYSDRFPDYPVLKIAPGEGSKQWKVIENLAGKLIKAGIDRSGFILAIGGGVVCDIAGFLASVYMRGIRCGYVSTTLLSQVDASTGGKNGVNLGVIKNIMGSFRQPEFVVCDTTMLRTLPEEEYLSGLAELIKTGIIGDKSIIETLEIKYKDVLMRDRHLLSDLVARSVKFKGSVVAKDEKEAGLRRILNFGHTFGHAIELTQEIKHGFAVASGMEIAAGFSLEKGFLSPKENERILNLLEKYRLLNKYDISGRKIEELISHDKKKTGSDLHFIFAQGIGSAIVKKIPVEEVIGFYRKFNRGKKR